MPTAEVQPISFSQLSTWLSCRYRWDLAWNKKISARVDSRPPTLGSLLHAGLAAAVRQHSLDHAEDDYDDSIASGNMAMEAWADTYEGTQGRNLWKEEQEALQALLEEAEAILEFVFPCSGLGTRYVVLNDRHGVPLIERTMRVPIKVGRRNIPFQFTIDVAVQDQSDGRKILWDYKIRKAFTSEERSQTNLQLAMYHSAMFWTGNPVDGSGLFEVRAKSPSIPKLNKNGTMSRAAITTTWPIYEGALVQAGLNPRDYDDMREHLATTAADWIRFHVHYRSPLELGEIWDRIVLPAAAEIGRQRTKQAVKPIRNMGYFSCMGCWAFDWCMTDLRGDDPTELIGTSYIERDLTHEEEVYDDRESEFQVQAVSA